MFAEIQDVIGPRHLWPNYIVRGLWECPINYKWRLCLTAFFYGNGCPVELFLNFLRVHRPTQFSERRAERIRGLYNYWNDPVEGFVRRNQRTYFDIVLQHVCNLNGNQVQVPARHAWNRFFEC